MKEIEIKILEINAEAIIATLQKIGAKKILEDTLINTYYDFPSLALKNEKKLLRVREYSNKTELTLKKKISKEKTKIEEEIQLEVSNPKEMHQILAEMGLIPLARTEKKRISYQWNQTHVDIDFYEGIPPLLEVEAPTEGLVKEMVKKLGFSMKDTKPWTGKDVFEHYGKTYY